MSKELIEQLRELSASRKPYATGAHGQIIGMEIYRIVANGFALECIDEAADRIEELERERDAFYMDYRMKCDEQTKSLCVGRDALQADNARLREVLDEAATSLETIQLRSYGDESYLNHMDQVRGFAGSRSRVAKEALAATPEQSLAEYRNKVIDDVERYRWLRGYMASERTDLDDEIVEACSTDKPEKLDAFIDTAIRAMKEPE